MDHRLQLQELLSKINGVKNVYFNPPTNTRMEYPCIRFSLAGRPAEYADNRRYVTHESYTVTFITRDPATAPKVLEQIEEIPLTEFDRPYVADGLYHYVYTKNY